MKKCICERKMSDFFLVRECHQFFVNIWKIFLFYLDMIWLPGQTLNCRFRFFFNFRFYFWWKIWNFRRVLILIRWKVWILIRRIFSKLFKRWLKCTWLYFRIWLRIWWRYFFGLFFYRKALIFFDSIFLQKLYLFSLHLILVT